MSSEKILDIFAFDKRNSVDTDSVPSLIKKIRDSKFYQSLPDWINDYDLPKDVIPSALHPVKCMQKLILLQKTKGFNCHPVNQLDLISGIHDVGVNNQGVVYRDNGEEKTLAINLGYLVPDVTDSKRIIAASTSDIIATDSKVDKQGNINVTEWAEDYHVHVSPVVRVREAFGNMTHSRTRTRDEIFTIASNPKNLIQATRLHSTLGKNLPNFTEVPVMTAAVTRYYKARKEKIPEDIAVKVVGIDNSPIPCTEDIILAYKMYHVSISTRGGRDGKNVSHGFERFTMSRVMANTLNLVQDFLNMSREFRSADVLCKDSSYLSFEEIRVLIHNKFRIILLNSLAPKMEKGSPPGVYSSFCKDSNYFEFCLLPDAQVKPIFEKKNITMGKHYDEGIARICRSKRCFSYVYLDNRLKDYEKVLSFLPSATADTMQIIAATGIEKSTYSLASLTKRATMAISCRNRFVHSRKTFSTIDIMRDFVKWDRVIYYPKLAVEEQKTILDLKQVSISEAMNVVPLDINEDDFVNEVEQAVAGLLTDVDRLETLLETKPDYILRVLAGNLIFPADSFCLVSDGESEWDVGNDGILDMKEKAYISLLQREGREKMYQLYTNYVAEAAAMVTDGDHEEAPSEVETPGAEGFSIDDVDLAFSSVNLGTVRKKN